MFWFWLARGVLVATLIAAAVLLRPAGDDAWLSAALGAGIATAVVWLEFRLHAVPVHRILGSLLGAALGLLVARLAATGLVWVNGQGATLAFVQTTLFAVLAYVGLVMGGRHADTLRPSHLLGMVRGGEQTQQHRILDTSVIIDGRIADVCETGFLDGVLVVPQSVLRELQYVADSSDSLKRNRGRRGLDILQKIQKMSSVQVLVSDLDFADVKEVDLKLIELARAMKGKIVTNDFNLNKVAQLRGIEVLNINELANALKPVVLPGEFMKVFILKEGKEYNQGVAYLDDGTMVVVDNARRLIGKTIDVVVTSVLQTTAGKMIFGRHIDSSQAGQAGPVAANQVGNPVPARAVGDSEDGGRRARTLPQT
ncbi:MAG: PIN/TRAM domain-containing protein [Vicinamibacterales bacterium]